MKIKHLILSLLFAFTALTSMVHASANEAPASVSTEAAQDEAYHPKTLPQLMQSFFETTGLNAMVNPQEGVKNGEGEDLSLFAQSWGRLIMFTIIFLLFYLAISFPIGQLRH